MVVLMLEYCLHGLCALPNMVINAKIMKKSAKSQEEEEGRDRCRSLSMMLVHYLHGLCTFPNMEINRKIRRKSEKLRKKRIDCC